MLDDMLRLKAIEMVAVQPVCSCTVVRVSWNDNDCATEIYGKAVKNQKEKLYKALVELVSSLTMNVDRVAKWVKDE